MVVKEEDRIAEWKTGRHTDADGKRWQLDRMNYEHLTHTIELFAHRLDVSPLRKSLRKKQRGLIPIVISYLERREKQARKKRVSVKSKERARLAKVARRALENFINV